jgi:hypothetical protein
MGTKSILVQSGDGTATPEGMVGYAKSVTNTVAGTLSGDNLIAQLSLNKGKWMITANAYLRPSSQTQSVLQITTGSSITAGTTGPGMAKKEATLNGDTLVTSPLFLNVTADGTAVNLRGSTVAASTSTGYTGYMEAVLIG